jgi:hypothetical protein
MIENVCCILHEWNSHPSYYNDPLIRINWDFWMCDFGELRSDRGFYEQIFWQFVSIWESRIWQVSFLGLKDWLPIFNYCLLMGDFWDSLNKILITITFIFNYVAFQEYYWSPQEKSRKSQVFKLRWRQFQREIVEIPTHGSKFLN